MCVCVRLRMRVCVVCVQHDLYVLVMQYNCVYYINIHLRYTVVGLFPDRQHNICRSRHIPFSVFSYRITGMYMHAYVYV